MDNKQLQYIYCSTSQQLKAAMKFGQLMKYDRNIFLEKSYTKCGGETILRTFSK